MPALLIECDKLDVARDTHKKCVMKMACLSRRTCSSSAPFITMLDLTHEGLRLFTEYITNFSRHLLRRLGSWWYLGLNGNEPTMASESNKHCMTPYIWCLQGSCTHVRIKWCINIKHIVLGDEHFSRKKHTFITMVFFDGQRLRVN